MLRHRAEGIEGQRLDARAFGEFQALQRQVAHTLAHGFRADRGDAQARYASYGEQLATLQRHTLSAPVARVVLGLVPPTERLPLQRATDDALQRLQAQEQAALAFDTVQAVQRQLAELDAEATQPVLQRIQARRGAGNPLPEAVQRHLEQGLNHDLSRVRIHDDAEADKLAKGMNAIAFTTGTDIFFQSGRFNPNTQSGLELLAHEVTHTVQQSQGRVGRGIDPDAGLEREARAMGAKLAQVMPSSKSLMPPVAHRSGPHAPGVYNRQAALGRVQAGAARHLSLKPLLDLQPGGWPRSTGDLAVQRFDLSSLNPVTAIKNGAAALVNKGKDLIASGLSRLPGYRELCLAFGRDLVTGQTISGSADSILTALTNWVPGPLKDILRALRETRVVDKAWQWFQGQLSKLNLSGVLGEVAGAIQAADLGKARSAVTSRISGVKSLILGCADHIAGIAMTALSAGLGPLGKTIMAGLRGAKGSVVQILKDPARFARNLVEAVKGGFKQFSTNAPKHLQRGVGQWLTGSTGISFPAKFDLQGVFLTALSVMGLTYQAMRGKLVKALGAGGVQKVSAAERTVEVLQSLKGGLDKAQEMKAEQGSAGKAVQDGIKTEVTNSLVLAGIQKVVTMLVPGGGLISAIIGAFQTVQTVVQQAAQIGQVITSGLSSVAAIAAGNISGAVGAIDRTLGGMIPIALTWLGKVAGLGNFGSKVKAVLQKVRGRLDRVVDKIVAKVKGLIEKLTGKNKGKRPESARDQADGTYGVVKFTAGKERHSVWAEIKNNRPSIMIASTPMNAIAQLQNFKKEAVAVGAEKGLTGHFQQAGQEVGKGLSILKKSVTSNDFNVKNRLNEQALTTNNRIARYVEVIRSVTQQAKLNPPRMHRVDIAFTTGSFPEQKREFLLQLREQEAGLNAMTIASWEKNRSAFVARFIATGSGRDTTVANRAQRTSTRLSKAALIDDLAANIMANDPSITLKEARKKAAPHAETWIQQQRPLHNPDQVAGGEPAPAHPMAMGGKDVNGSIGPQWKTRIGQLDSEVAAYKASYPGVDCKKVNVNVRLTLS
ncbi:hypothetical protein GCM10010842_30510 [Deinococcus daejeonensis]|uniref:DUF4157 domain-containing protein n=1 Tax=Deinococcus daejeonensis TaxID=1007098 RepID=A0ABQ2J9V9_9DEIO|nr:hypothetical protein GCM10010842_30510 [Deinococcus daejeonensis]